MKTILGSLTAAVVVALAVGLVVPLWLAAFLIGLPEAVIRAGDSRGFSRSVTHLLALCLLLAGCADDTGTNRLAWQAKHPRFAPRERVRDRNFEAALEADRKP